MRRRYTAWMVLVLLLGLGAVIYVGGWLLDFEFVHWPTIWQASRTKTPAGVRVDDLLRKRAGGLSPRPHWHHCGWCDTAFSHAPHFAIKVTVGKNEVYLFDWDDRKNLLVPITVHTAEVFPELVPRGYRVEPCPNASVEQLRNDQACRIVREIPET